MAELIIICIFIFAMACLDKVKDDSQNGCCPGHCESDEDDDEDLDFWEDDEIFEKPVLLIDMDGVIADYYGHFVSIWTKLYPNRIVLKPEELRTFHFEQSYPPEFTADIRRITTSKGFFETMPVVPEAIEALKKILADGNFDPFLCSTPDSHTEDHSCASEKTRWVHAHLGEEWLKRIILTHDKTLVMGVYLIDDKPTITGANSEPAWTRIIFDQAYNRGIGGIRLNSWKHWDCIEETVLNDFVIL